MNKIKQKYNFIGGNLSVDFVNTEVIVKGELVDLLLSDNDVIDWLEQANIDADAAQGVDLSKLIKFRVQVRHILTQIIDNENFDDNAIVAMNGYLKNYKTNYQLEKTSDGYQLINQNTCKSTLDLVGLFAFELVNLIASDQLKYLKRCLNPDCILIFVDNSKSHKRRWCSMGACGNRAKVSKYYRKIKS